MCYRDGKELIATENREILDMDELVFPYENLSLFEHRLFIMRAAGDVRFPVATVFLPLIKSCGFGVFPW